MTQDENKIYQIIYTGEEESDKNTKPPIEWTVEELRNAVMNSESINNYYCTDKHKSAWLFAKKSELDNELWRKCETYTYYGYEIYASNRGRIRVKKDGKYTICKLYEEISKNTENKEYKKRLTKLLFNILIKNKETHIGYLLAKIPDSIKRNVHHEYFGLRVYQMVADAWLADKYEPGMEIHHITNDGYDNRPENLILVSATEHKKIHSGNYGKEDNEYKPGKYDKK